PSQLVARAAAAGVEMLALTDHDTLAGLPEAQQAAAEAAIELITGIEISSTWSGRELHIVGLNMQADHPDLQALVAAQQQARVRRAE
ncbi:PHP domain-containing protein, partial [Isoptericola croceus]